MTLRWAEKKSDRREKAEKKKENDNELRTHAKRTGKTGSERGRFNIDQVVTFQLSVREILDLRYLANNQPVRQQTPPPQNTPDSVDHRYDQQQHLPPATNDHHEIEERKRYQLESRRNKPQKSSNHAAVKVG